MKNFLPIFLFLFTISAKAQKEDLTIPSFKLTVTITEFSNALAGELQYVLTDDKLEITHIPIFGASGIVESTQLYPNKTLQKFAYMDLDIFEILYNNEKIMMTSGQMIAISYEKNGVVKEILFHCYYSKLLGRMAGLFNELVSREYKIDVCMIK